MNILVIVFHTFSSSSKVICKTIAEAKCRAEEVRPHLIEVGYFVAQDKELLASVSKNCNERMDYSQVIDELCEKSRQKMSAFARGQKTDLKANRLPGTIRLPRSDDRNYGKKYAVPPRIRSW